MVLYCYRTSDGVLIERAFPLGKAPKRISVGGKKAARSLADENKVFHMGEVRGSVRPGKTWPMTCFASGVHASQAGELRDHLAQAGVPTQVTADGDPVYRSAAHRKKALKARGLVDKKSYC